ncbi:hypothetical protein [Mycobacterium sp. IDR2000157661]|uniref:hypothetical protein n=1 Tax=Mycobacterium sp. IDR2000157661 TaxID=2867005 RepID=UPI001EEA4205|nr:hypothetical protein [Mycobacterium sp. IDR2000157661]ULE33328.1 hypothetical protein K3G64_00960 [Mycobacterium sp. IDR2000157661]
MTAARVDTPPHRRTAGSVTDARHRGPRQRHHQRNQRSRGPSVGQRGGCVGATVPRGQGTAEKKRDEAVAAAIKAASASDRIATVQESRLTIEESAQAFSVVIVPAPIKGGRSGWHVLNDSDQPVTRVAVSSATGAKIQVYNNDLTQFEE